MLHFWQLTNKSIENSCTFMFQTCLQCQRAWHDELRPAARPICIMNSYDAAEALEHYSEGHPYAYNLPEWDPLGCSYFLHK